MTDMMRLKLSLMGGITIDAALPFHFRHPLDDSLSSCPAADAGSYSGCMAVRLADLGEVVVMISISIPSQEARPWSSI